MKKAKTLRRILVAAALPLVAVALSAGAAKDPIPSFARELPQVKSGEPILAFNGKDLSGFYVYTHDHHYEDPLKVFTVNDGIIRVSGEEFGGFATREEYSDYHLIAEWRWGDKTWEPRTKAARDSGILLHCVGPDGAAGGHWMESQECQIIEGGCGDLLMVAGKGKPTLSCETVVKADKQLYYSKGGEKVTKNAGRYNWWGRNLKWTDTIGFQDEYGVEKPHGEWNRLEVICKGDTITNIMNGYVVNVGTGSSLTKGKIQFQSEAAEIFFRKIEVRPLLP
ncbi:3-keto-disaccharide hydrolase [Singulisphaera sp. PoT]|uniref:3-keto-disaccharide hydrolase n=1 Tax=Singulisphaera sp. PoT TaxID=3411797 RepID=UPI003BF52ABE